MNFVAKCRTLTNVMQIPSKCGSKLSQRLSPLLAVPQLMFPVHRVCLHTGQQCRNEARTVIRKMRSEQSGNKIINEGGIFMLAIPVITFCLGTWQVRRRTWKMKKIKDMEARTKAAPLAFPSDLEELEDLEYRKVRITGHFDHSQELYIRPRSPVEGSHGSQDSGLISAGRIQTGAYVVTPFTLADSGLKILVNRGWVPREKVKPVTRKEGQVEGETSFVAVVRRGEKRPYVAAENDIARNVWMHRDVEAMSEHLQTAPVFLDADLKSTVQGGPLGGQTKVTLYNDHLQYLITWYSLCAITTFMWYKRYLARR